MEGLRRSTLERLMQYYRFLAELAARRALPTVTSAQIAVALDVDPTQVRKDFAAIGLMGIGRVGYDVHEVCYTIRMVLGLDQKHEAVLIGTGHLGGALLAYSGFGRYGLHVTAAFDNDGDAVGGKIAGHVVQPMEAMRSFLRRQRIRLAILAPPTEASEGLVDRLVSAGVKAIWNFTPTQVVGAPGILVRNERHFSIGLSEIAYHLKQ